MSPRSPRPARPAASKAFALHALCLFAVALLAGCISSGVDREGTPAPAGGIETYSYRYDGDAVAKDGVPYGYMVRISNGQNDSATLRFETDHAAATTVCHATQDGCAEFDTEHTFALEPRSHMLLLVQQMPNETWTETAWYLTTEDGSAVANETRALSFVPGGAMARPGDHVDTVTVGVWTNGTIFYTNADAVNADETSPAGYARAQFDATPLPIYVYDESASEQPIGSRDTCHFTTITGYNDLLKTQADQTTNLRWLAPEEAYTRPGVPQDFFLYGDALVFLNTIVAHNDGTRTTDEAPDPTGACFDPTNAQRKVPPAPVDPPQSR